MQNQDQLPKNSEEILAANLQSSENNKTIATSPPDPMVQSSAGSLVKPLPSKARRIKLVGALIIILAIIIALAAVWYFKFYKSNNQNSQNANLNSQNVTPTVAPSPVALRVNGVKTGDFCFVRLGYLVCLNKQTYERTRYDLPKLSDGSTITWLATDVNQSLFVAVTSPLNSDNKPKVALLNNSLQIIKEITLPANMYATKPTLSRDALSIFLGLSDETSTSLVRNYIYRYDIASSQFTKLTTEDNCSSPNQVSTGDVIFSCYTSPGSVWTARVLNQEVLNYYTPNTYLIDSIYTYSYDQDSEDVYFIGDSSGTATLGYANMQAIRGQAQPLTLVTLPDIMFESSGTTIAKWDDSHVLLADYDYAKVMSLNGGYTQTLTSFGQVVGVLNSSGFTKSAVQTESPYERIDNLGVAPAEFQTFLKAQFDQKDAQCRSNDEFGGDRFQFGMTVNKVVRDAFASVGEGCGGGGANVMYVKSGNAWEYAFALQATPDCATVNKYHFTKEILPQCYEGSNLIANPDP